MLAALIAFALLTSGAPAAVAPSRERGAAVTTVAAGLDDPVAVAFDRTTMTTVVADAGTARIDRIAADGSVSPVAGSSEGDRDGAAAEAQFRKPAAIAVEADGAIVVADRGNRRIRRIANGIVATLAPSTPFLDPEDVVAATDGTIYVADEGAGIRAIAGDAVAPVASGDATKAVSHLAIWNGPQPALFFVTPEGVGRIDLATKAIVTQPSGGVVFAPAAIVALNGTQFVASLPRYQALYFSTADLKYPWWRRVAGTPSDDATVAGSFADGPPGDSRFDTPGGLALDTAGNILVADAGNHRVRRVPALDLRWDSGTGLLAPDPTHYRIGLISNSIAFYGTMWQDSIGGVLEDRLAADASQLRIAKPLEVRSLWLGNSFDAQDSYFENSIVPGSFDCVVWAFDYNNFNDAYREWPVYAPPFDPEASRTWATQIRRGVSALRANGIRVVLTDVPFGFQASPSENAGFREQYSATASPAYLDALRDPDEGYQFMLQMETLLGSLGVPYVPSYDRILAYERGPHAPLYSPLDNHFSPAGTAFFGDLLATQLESSGACSGPSSPASPAKIHS